MDASFLSDAQIERERAADWIRENPDAWAWIVGEAVKEARAERRFSPRYLAESLRSKDFVSADGSSSTVSNNLTPSLARHLVEQHPEVKPWMELRRSRCDDAFKDDLAAA